MPKRPIAFIREFKTSRAEWVHVGRNSEKEKRLLGERYHFHHVDLQEILPPLQRPKVVVREGYIFMILLFPVFDPETRVISTAEVDFFISPDRLITVSGSKLPAFDSVFDVLSQKTSKTQSANAAHILHSILDALLESLFPMLIHISHDIDDVEKGLFEAKQRGVIMELLRIKTNIVNIRKAMQGHKKAIRMLMAAGTTILPINRMEDYYNQLVDYTKEIWDTLEVQRETINALHETHSSLIDSRTNEIMKTLTIISVIVFPMTLIATLFAMRVNGLPWADDPSGFTYVILILVALGASMLGFFKYKKWI